jgi:hypothetical protein
MAEAIMAASRIDRHTCRPAASERFRLARMVDEYFAVYGRLSARKRGDAAASAA